MLSNSLNLPFSKIKHIYLQLGLLSQISGESQLLLYLRMLFWLIFIVNSSSGYCTCAKKSWSRCFWWGFPHMTTVLDLSTEIIVMLTCAPSRVFFFSTPSVPTCTLDSLHWPLHWPHGNTDVDGWWGLLHFTGSVDGHPPKEPSQTFVIQKVQRRAWQVRGISKEGGLIQFPKAF